MKSRIIDACLTLLGVSGLMIYVLACAPSFSPDGKKVAFPVIDYDADDVSILVYDIRKNKFETVAELTNPNLSNEDAAYSVQWMPDGKQILITGTSIIMMSSVESKGPTRTFQPDEDMKFYTLLTPPVVGNYQFILDSDEPVIYRINLQNWETQSFNISLGRDGPSPPFSDGKQIYFAFVQEKEDQTFYSFMNLDMGNGKYTPVAQINSDESGSLEGLGLAMLEGDRFAVGSKYQDRPHIVILHGNSIEKMIPIGEKEENINLGNIVQSPDGESLFAAINSHDRFSVIEVPLDGRKIRKLDLFAGNGMDDNKNSLAFRIALSPDGKKIAASSVSGLEYTKLKSEDRALYLVDVGPSEWRVKKIPVPLKPASKRAAVE